MITQWLPSNPTDVAVSIFVIIVLYRISPDECEALKSFQASLAHASTKGLRTKLLLYDNTPGGHPHGALSKNVTYQVSPGNYGLASAYNVALSMAASEDYEWLLTLDQDTKVPESFLDHVAALAKKLKEDTRVAAIAPRVLDRGILITPQIVAGATTNKLPKNFIGIPRDEVLLINSGTTWRVRDIQEIGGFNPLFWLDYLDYWMCHTLHRAGKKIYLAGDLNVDHELSLRDPENRISPARFENYLLAQSAFFDMCKSPMDGLALTVRLLLRLGMQVMRGWDTRLQRLTWECFKMRILQSGSTRLRNWRRLMNTHMST